MTKVIIKNHRNEEITNFDSIDFNSDDVKEILKKSNLWWYTQIEYHNSDKECWSSPYQYKAKRLISCNNNKSVRADWNVEHINGKATQNDINRIIEYLEEDMEILNA